MAKGGGGGRGIGSSAAGNGIMGSGVHYGLGSLVTCNSTDTSAYCGFQKFMNVFFQILMLLFSLYFAYIVVWPLLRKTKK